MFAQILYKQNNVTQVKKNTQLCTESRKLYDVDHKNIIPPASYASVLSILAAPETD
jgi:hypothetical protein